MNRGERLGRWGGILSVWAASVVGLQAMDRVRVEAGIDEAVARYGVTGTNVLIAVLDRGIDWRNADFRDADGKTRIDYIYDLLDPSGAAAPGNFQGKGTVYTRAQIDAALAGGAALATRDAVGHGTTTAAIAGGGGRNDARFRGVAPAARYLIVKLVSDGAPAHDAEPAEAGFYDPALIPVAIDFVKAKAKELGKPCVMLLNIGSVGGPTDGTSSLARKIDATVGPGIPGLVFVTGTSDDGTAANRAGGVLTQGQVASVDFEKVGTGTLTFDLWYPETDRFDVRVVTPGGTFGPYTAPEGPNSFDTKTTAQFLYYQLGRDRDFNEAANAKRQLWIRFTGAAGSYRVELTARKVVGGRFDATLNPSRFNPAGTPISRFTSFVAPGSIWDLATATNNVCPNSYVVRTNYTDVDGVRRTLKEGAVGELWKGSGVGPTFDGRIGVDVSAPGDSLMTTYAPNSYWATFRFNRVASAAGVYGRASAVSAANPIVTGVVALLLEMDPTLDAGQVKQLLHEGARADAFTGAVPNPIWGYGKLNALESIQALHRQLTELSAERAGDTGLRIKARGQSGIDYVLQESVDLAHWNNVATNRAAGGIQFEIPTGATGGPRFLRLRRGLSD